MSQQTTRTNAGAKKISERVVAHKATIAIEAMPQWFTLETDSSGTEYAVFYLRTGDERGAAAIKVMDARAITVKIVKKYAQVRSATGQTATKAQEILERATVDLPKYFRKPAEVSMREERKDGKYNQAIVLRDISEKREGDLPHLVTATWFTTGSHSYFSFGGHSRAQKQMVRRTKGYDDSTARSVIVTITSERTPLWIDLSSVNPEKPEELTITTYQFKDERSVFQKKTIILSEEILEGKGAGSIMSTVDARSQQSSAEEGVVEEERDPIPPPTQAAPAKEAKPKAAKQTAKSQAQIAAEELEEQFGETPKVIKIARKNAAKKGEK